MPLALIYSEERRLKNLTFFLRSSCYISRLAKRKSNIFRVFFQLLLSENASNFASTYFQNGGLIVVKQPETQVTPESSKHAVKFIMGIYLVSERFTKSQTTFTFLQGVE